MNKIVDIEGVPHEVAPVNREAIEPLYASGVLQAMGKVELVDGVLVRTSPSQSPHGAVTSLLNAQLVPAIIPHFKIGTDIGVFLEDHAMRAPDIVVYNRSAQIRFLAAEDIVLAIEIADSSLQGDLSVKAALYAKHGFEEYWVIDVAGRSTHVFRQPSRDGYLSNSVADWSDKVSPLCAPELSLTLADFLDGNI